MQFVKDQSKYIKKLETIAKKFELRYKQINAELTELKEKGTTGGTDRLVYPRLSC